MTEDDLPPEEGERTDQAIAAVLLEGTRVGVDWDVVATTLLRNLPEAAPSDTADGSPELGLDVDLLLPILRSLPDGVGTAAFLSALAADE